MVGVSDAPTRDDSWHSAVDALAAYAGRHGTTYPDKSARIPGSRSRGLRAFASNTRSAYRRGDLSPERIRDVEQTVPGWKWRTRKERHFHGYGPDRWRRRVADYAAWVASHGRLPAHNAAEARELALYHFGRAIYHSRASGKVPQDAVEMMSAVPGWTWEKASPRPWADQIPRMVAFVQEHGRCPDKRAEDEAERALALWWKRRAVGRYQRLLDEQELKQLAWLEGHVLYSAWLACYRRAVDLAAGRLGGSRARETRKWLRHQRASGRLNERQRALLAALGDVHESAVLAAWCRRAALVREDPTNRANVRWLRMRRAELASGHLRAWQRPAVEALADIEVGPTSIPENFAGRNADRTAAAATERVAAARRRLADPATPDEYRPVLQARVDYPGDSLRELGARLGWNKDRYASMLARALRER